MLSEAASPQSVRATRLGHACPFDPQVRSFSGLAVGGDYTLEVEEDPELAALRELEEEEAMRWLLLGA